MRKKTKVIRTRKKKTAGFKFAVPQDYALIIENLQQWVCVKDLNGVVVYLNPYAQKMARSLIGRSLIGKHSTDFVSAESVPICRQVLKQIQQGRNPKPHEVEAVIKGGKRLPMLVTESPIRRGKEIIGSLGFAVDISEKREKEAELLMRMKEISTLNAIALVLSETCELDALLNRTLDKILEMTETEAGGICLLDERRQELILRVHRGLSPKVVETSTAIRVGQGISGRVAATKKPVIIEDLAADKRLTRPLLLREGFRSAAIVPVTLRGKGIGVFNILTRKVRRYTPSEAKMLINIGNQIGIAIENASLLKTREEEISRLHALNRISHIISSEISLDALLERVYEQVKTILHPENFCITLYNKDHHAFDVILKYEKDVKKRKYSFPASQGLSSKVFFNKKPILTKDYLTECHRQCVEPYGPPTKAWLGVPIIEKGKAIGCIYIYDYVKGDLFDEHDLELLTTIAGQTAVVIENVRQYKVLQQRVEELELLFEIGQNVVSIVDLDTVLYSIINMLKKKFGHEKCSILFVNEASNELYIKARIPLTENLRKRRFKIGETGITGMVATTGKTYYAPDVRKEPNYFEIFSESRSELVVPLKVGDRIIGVLNMEADVVDAFSEEDIKMVESVSNQAAIAIENARLYESLEHSYFDTIRALVSAMEAKDAYTRGHSERVRKLALQVGEFLGLSTEEIKMLDYAGYLHDIGKIGVSDHLLSKVEPLEAEEFDKIRLHPVIGHNMIKHVDFLSEVSGIIRHEHEKYDGSGYPDRLKGDNIPLGARIIAVADAYDAMITDRPYRKALGKHEVVRRIQEASGTQFDPRAVAAILHVIKDDGRPV